MAISQAQFPSRSEPLSLDESGGRGVLRSMWVKITVWQEKVLERLRAWERLSKWFRGVVVAATSTSCAMRLRESCRAAHQYMGYSKCRV